MKKNSPSFIKWMSTRKKQPKRRPLTSRMSTAIERAWSRYLQGGFRPPLDAARGVLAGWLGRQQPAGRAAPGRSGADWMVDRWGPGRARPGFVVPSSHASLSLLWSAARLSIGGADRLRRHLPVGRQDHSRLRPVAFGLTVAGVGLPTSARVCGGTAQNGRQGLLPAGPDVTGLIFSLAERGLSPFRLRRGRSDDRGSRVPDCAARSSADPP